MQCPVCQVTTESSATRCPNGHPLRGNRIPRAVMKLRYSGDTATFVWMALRHIVLAVLTFGLHRFWGTATERRYLYGALKFAETPFAYHGQGGEVFWGWIRANIFLAVASALFLLLVFSGGWGMFGGLPIFSLLEMSQSAMGKLLGWIVWIFVCSFVIAVFGMVVGAVVGAAATVSSLRYRLHNTSWRGIRFSFHGSFLTYLTLLLQWGALSAVSVGLAIPYCWNEHRRYIVNHTHFGNQAFRYTGTSSVLYRPFLIAWVLGIASLFLRPRFGFVMSIPFILSVTYFLAVFDRHHWDHTHFLAAKCRIKATIQELMIERIPFVLLLYVSSIMPWLLPCFYLARPLIIMRSFQFLGARLQMAGALNLDQIVQDVSPGSAMGEGIAELDYIQ